MHLRSFRRYRDRETGSLHSCAVDLLRRGSDVEFLKQMRRDGCLPSWARMSQNQFKINIVAMRQMDGESEVNLGCRVNSVSEHCHVEC